MAVPGSWISPEQDTHDDDRRRIDQQDETVPPEPPITSALPAAHACPAKRRRRCDRQCRDAKNASSKGVPILVRWGQSSASH
jgi:hypothetical protein